MEKEGLYNGEESSLQNCFEGRTACRATSQSLGAAAVPPAAPRSLSPQRLHVTNAQLHFSAPRPCTIPASSDTSRISAPKYYPYPFKYHLHHVSRPIYLCFSYQYFNEILFFNIANILLTENSTSMDAYMPGHYAG